MISRKCSNCKKELTERQLKLIGTKLKFCSQKCFDEFFDKINKKNERENERAINVAELSNET
jgi:hypothetical protein